MIYIIRHGQTDLNSARVLQGRSNAPLNEVGIAQAEEAGEWLQTQGILFDRVYTSPLRRAMQTAEIVVSRTLSIDDAKAEDGCSGGCAGDSSGGEKAPREFITDERLLEMDYGPYEGADLTDPAPEIVTFFRDFINNPAPEGMEPLADVVSRLGDFLEDLHDDLSEDLSDGPSANVLISTHAIAMKGALEYLTPKSRGSYWSKHIANCDVYVFEMLPEGFSVPEPLEKSLAKSFE